MVSKGSHAQATFQLVVNYHELFRWMGLATNILQTWLNNEKECWKDMENRWPFFQFFWWIHGWPHWTTNRYLCVNMWIEQHGSTWGIPLKSNAQPHFESTWPVMCFFEMWPICKLAHVSTHELDEVSRCRITGIPLATATESLWAVGRTLGVWGCWGKGWQGGGIPGWLARWLVSILSS